MAAARLELQHHLSQPLVTYLVLKLLFVCLGDLVILAVNTTQIAVAEEDVARAFSSDQRRLFTKVWCVGGDDRQPARIARRNFVVEPVVQAIARTDGAALQQTLEFFNPALEQPTVEQVQIRWCNCARQVVTHTLVSIDALYNQVSFRILSNSICDYGSQKIAKSRFASS